MCASSSIVKIAVASLECVPVVASLGCVPVVTSLRFVPLITSLGFVPVVASLGCAPVASLRCVPVVASLGCLHLQIVMLVVALSFASSTQSFPLRAGQWMAQLVEALLYKPEGRGFDSRWCHWNFSLTLPFRPHYGPRVDSASNRNRNIS